jgi:hypothetical protein
VVDVQTMAVTDTISLPVGYTCYTDLLWGTGEAMIHADGKLYVAMKGGAGGTRPYLIKVDIATAAVEGTALQVDATFGGSFARLAWNGATKIAYIIGQSFDPWIVDISSWTVDGYTTRGSYHSYDVAWVEQLGKFVVAAGWCKLYDIDPATRVGTEHDIEGGGSSDKYHTCTYDGLGFLWCLRSSSGNAGSCNAMDIFDVTDWSRPQQPSPSGGRHLVMDGQGHSWCIGDSGLQPGNLWSLQMEGWTTRTYSYTPGGVCVFTNFLWVPFPGEETVRRYPLLGVM